MTGDNAGCFHFRDLQATSRRGLHLSSWLFSEPGVWGKVCTGSGTGRVTAQSSLDTSVDITELCFMYFRKTVQLKGGLTGAQRMPVQPFERWTRSSKGWASFCSAGYLGKNNSLTWDALSDGFYEAKSDELVNVCRKIWKGRRLSFLNLFYPTNNLPITCYSS